MEKLFLIDLLHQGPCSSDCHHLSLLAPIQRTRHSSHELTGGRVVLEQAGRERGRGHLGPWGSRLLPGFAWYLWLRQDVGGLEEEGLSGRAEGQDYAQARLWLCLHLLGFPRAWLEPHRPTGNHPDPSAQLGVHKPCSWPLDLLGASLGKKWSRGTCSTCPWA